MPGRSSFSGCQPERSQRLASRNWGATEIVDELNAIYAQSPGLSRLILQASVAALVNYQSVEAVDEELKRRAVETN
jgi:hypothetical protein